MSGSLSQNAVRKVLEVHRFRGGSKPHACRCGYILPDPLTFDGNLSEAVAAHQAAEVWALIEDTTDKQWGVHLFTSQGEPDFVSTEEEARKTHKARTGFFSKLVSRRVTNWKEES